MTPRLMEKDWILSTENGLLIHNQGAVVDCNLYLPPPRPLLRFEILQLSEYGISLITNRENSVFLLDQLPHKIIIHGTPENYGKSVILGTFEGNWRILFTSFDQQHLTFED